MILIVFIIGALNLAVGYGLAVWMRRWMDSAEVVSSFSAAVANSPPVVESPPESEAEEDPLADVEDLDSIPAEWVDRLAAESIQAQSFVEATAQVVRLEVGKYREALVRLEDEFRRDLLAPPLLKSVAKRLMKLNEHWMKAQAEATEHLANRKESLTAFADIGIRLYEMLEYQQPIIQSCCQELQNRDYENDTEGGFEHIADQICQLVNLAHLLRDEITEALLATLRAEDRFGELDKKLRKDVATGLLSRVGVEIIVTDWWKGDPARHRLSSAAILDLVGIEQYNRTQGTRFGDRLIGAAGSLLEDLVRKERGFDIASRVAGQRFFMFFGDTGPRNATSAIERLRQTIAESTFEYGEDAFSVRVSCSVTEVLKDDDIPSLLARLETDAGEAKKAGRNCTMLDEGEGPKAVDPPAYQVPGRVVQIEEE